MNEEMKTKVLSLLDKAQADLQAGNNTSAVENIEAAKDIIKRPIGGGITGPEK